MPEPGITVRVSSSLFRKEAAAPGWPDSKRRARFSSRRQARIGSRVAEAWFIALHVAARIRSAIASVTTRGRAVTGRGE